MKKYVLYHGQCRDGFGAAYAFWRHPIYRDATFIPVFWNTPPPPMEDGSEVYIVDFAYERDELLKLKERMSLVRVIDHHETSVEWLDGLDFVTFDMTKSGCRLAWEFVAGPDDEWGPPRLLNWIEDKDLWVWKLAHTKEAMAGLETYPFDFEVWSRLADDPSEMLARGEVLVPFIDEIVAAAISRVRMVEIGGYRVPVTNATTHWSEIGAALCETHPDAPFVMTYVDMPTGRKWSLRSNGKFNVRVFAQKFGGGGHPQAAGFQMPLHIDKFEPTTLK